MTVMIHLWHILGFAGWDICPLSAQVFGCVTLYASAAFVEDRSINEWQV